jgi:hypothetical protein
MMRSVETTLRAVERVPAAADARERMVGFIDRVLTNDGPVT